MNIKEILETANAQIRTKFNVYFYDGRHQQQDQEKAITYFYECMEDTFLYICDDYNVEHIQIGTQSGIQKSNLKIINEETILSRHNGDTEGFWNGIYIAVLQK